MLSEGKNVYILDDSIINSTKLCFDVINKYIKHGDIYISFNSVLKSDNINLKNYVISKSNKSHDENLNIKVNDNYIFIQNKPMIDIYYFIKELCNTKIISLSHNVMMESMIKNISCELYVKQINESIEFDIEKINSIPNHFYYDQQSHDLFRFTNNMWNQIHDKSIYDFQPINYKQKAYLDLLLDDKIKLVLCSGSAGSGKTFLACLTGLYDMMDNRKYDEMIISRATIDIGDNSIGFLPGTKEEKMKPWIQPIKDNLKLIMDKKQSMKTYVEYDQIHEYEFESTYESTCIMTKKERKKIQKKTRKQNRLSYIPKHKIIKSDSVDDLIQSEKIKIDCISFFRGRTFINTICVIDEAQNLTSHEIKTIITRVGNGSKLILIGDNEQSDLKKRNTDFADVINKMHGNDIVGIIHLDKTIRSDIASLAVKIL